jgi:hypothetical protein
VIPCRSLQHILIALLSVFLFLPWQVMGAVVCIGADGHIAVEVAQKGRCGLLAQSVPPYEQITTTSPSTDHCGSCVDVPLLTSDTDSRQPLPTFPLWLQLETPALALVPWVVSASPALALTPCWLYPSRVTNTTLSALRTVMLLL